MQNRYVGYEFDRRQGSSTNKDATEEDGVSKM